MNNDQYALTFYACAALLLASGAVLVWEGIRRASRRDSRQLVLMCGWFLIGAGMFAGAAQMILVGRSIYVPERDRPHATITSLLLIAFAFLAVGASTVAMSIVQSLRQTAPAE